MLKKVGITMAFVGALMFTVGVANTFAAACGCRKMQSVQIHVKREKQTLANVNINNQNSFYFSCFNKSKSALYQ